MFMIVLKSRLSGYYFKDFGAWTSDPLDARAFASESLAREFVGREHLQDVQIVDREVSALELRAAA